MGKAKILGNKIKTLRSSKNMSLEELAEKANLTLEQLSTIEESEVLPSTSPLVKIARALDVRLSTILDDENSVGPVVCRQDDTEETLKRSQNGDGLPHMNYLSLAKTKSGRHMEPYIINLQACSEKDFIMSSHEGEEFLYVLQGAIEITYGENIYILFEGDSIYYDSIVEHHVECDCETGAKILAVVYSPI